MILGFFFAQLFSKPCSVAVTSSACSPKSFSLDAVTEGQPQGDKGWQVLRSRVGLKIKNRSRKQLGRLLCCFEVIIGYFMGTSDQGEPASKQDTWQDFVPAAAWGQGSSGLWG